jgi:hypothetical protein
MTKRDFVSLAAIISSMPNKITKHDLIHEMCMFCGDQNQWFDDRRFIEACGVDLKEYYK